MSKFILVLLKYQEKIHMDHQVRPLWGLKEFLDGFNSMLREELYIFIKHLIWYPLYSKF